VLRSTYLIDPSGKIAWHWPEVIPQGHAERVRAKLQELSSRK
jgi:peroxiredoxin